MHVLRVQSYLAEDVLGIDAVSIEQAPEDTGGRGQQGWVHVMSRLHPFARV
jgi:hypothetical protein